MLLATLSALLAGCGPEAPRPAAAGSTAAAAPAPASAAPFADARVTPEVVAKWSRSCALCHADGTGGAPVAGNAEGWARRLAQGEAVLLAHTVEGFNAMPPLGYCMDCGWEDFRALIRFMALEPGAPAGGRS